MKIVSMATEKCKMIVSNKKGSQKGMWKGNYHSWSISGTDVLWSPLFSALHRVLRYAGVE